MEKKNDGAWAQKVAIMSREKLLAVGEACVATF